MLDSHYFHKMSLIGSFRAPPYKIQPLGGADFLIGGGGGQAKTGVHNFVVCFSLSAFPAISSYPDCLEDVGLFILKFCRLREEFRR